jgi:hypothetical protein
MSVVMKTRELLQCDIKTFGARMAQLKPKELYRHMERISAALGEPDLESLLRSAVAGLFVGGTMPQSSDEEMDRVFDAIATHIVPTQENTQDVLRLLALCVSFLRHRIKEAARERRLVERAAGHGARCEDPRCAQPGHVHAAQSLPAVPETLLARGIRTAID